MALLQQPSFRRLIRAVDLASEAPGSHLLISGSAEVGLVNEAQIAKEFVLRFRWPEERLTIEDRSTDTLTSAQEVAEVLKSEAIAQPVLLVTSALHMRRAQFAYRQAGVAVLACAADYVALFPIFPDSLIPEAGALQKAGEGWKEVMGLAVYAMRSAFARRE